MKSQWRIALGLALTLIGTACSPVTSTPSETVTPTRTEIPRTPTRTPTATRAPTATRRSTATSVPTRTATPAPTPIVIADPRLESLEQQGYERVDVSGFSVGATTSDMAFGGPDTGTHVSQLVSGTLAYLQYAHPETQDCVLVFARAEGARYAVLDAIMASRLNERLHALLSPTSDAGASPVFCSPQGWGDANDNGLPDIAVALLWGNHYTGSETHLFEVNSEDRVRDLFADLPGIVSPWSYDPSDPVVTVFDLQWADHDCLYPPMALVWLYGWRGDQYVDITAELDLSSYLQNVQGEIEQSVGQPFNPYFTIEPLTQLLVMYDRIGQRAAGWLLYKRLADLKNWPGTDEASAAWLKSDVDHFAQEVRSGAPLTANNHCDGP